MTRLRSRFAIIIALGSALLLASCNYLQMASAPDDKAIASEIQGKVFEDPVLKTRDIRVVSEKGAVVLTGSVATELEKSAVERFASKAKGVKQVINQFAVTPSTVAAAPAAETAARPARRRAAWSRRPARRAAREPRRRSVVAQRSAL
ncbi:MAG: BON domain-containing protein [Terriglobia bacterium]